MFQRFADSRLYHPRPWNGETPESLGFAFEDLFFESEGLRLHGWWLPAPGASLGAVVHAHGNAATLVGQLRSIGPLVEHGFDLFLFDYRGYGQSEGKPTRRGIQADVRAAIGAAVSRAGGPVAFWGQSLGAAHGLVAAPGRSDLVCLVAEAPFTRHRLAVQRHIHLPFVSGLLSRLGFPEDCDPIDHVAHLPCPVLFLHGTRDPIVPSEMSEALHARAPEPKSLVMLPGHGHCKGSPERERRVRDTVAEYLREQFTRPA